MAQKLYLHQELTLLAIRDDKGTFSGGMFLYAVGGAMVSELLLREKIATSDDKYQNVAVVDSTSSGDPIMDELLHDIQNSKKPKALQHWVTKVASMPKLKHRIAKQLCEMGILKSDERKILWLFTEKVYPEFDGSFEDAIRDRMADAMFDTKVLPDGGTAVLIALASQSGLLASNFPKEELRQHKKRIQQLAKGDILAAGATQAAIQAIQAAIMVATIIPAIVVSTTTH